MIAIEYKKIMDRLLTLPSCALLTTGRTGTDLLQSLFDSHPEVLTFNGSLFFHSFWNDSMCVKACNFEAGDLIDEFIGKHIEKLKTKYDKQERKDQLGDGRNQCIDIDLGRFRNEAVGLLNGREINSKIAMLAIYGAYCLCINQDIEEKKILFHHIHHAERLNDYLDDFSDSKIIAMTRDPRANFVSGVENWRKYRPSTDCGAHLYYYIKRILEDVSALELYSNEYTAIRIEDLGREDVLRRLCDWLGISYNECLKKSTWAGLAWHGDRLSVNKKKSSGWSGDMLKNNWETRLSAIDKYVLNYLMFYRLKHYGYSYKKISILDLIMMPFFILLPVSYELRFLSFSYIGSCLRKKEYYKMLQNAMFYLRRIYLFFKYYIKTTLKRKFNQPFLTC